MKIKRTLSADLRAARGRRAPSRRGVRWLVVRALSAAATRGHVELGSLRYSCALGRSGQRACKREGDGATPIGHWRLLEVFYRADRCPRPASVPSLRVAPIRRHDGWCDAVGDRNYNRRVRHPYPASAEQLWREDGLYDVVVVLDYNVRRRARGHGSAIFMHVARPDLAPTAGCVALARPALLRVLRAAGRTATIRIGR